MSASAGASPTRSAINKFVIPLAATAIAFGGGWSLGAGKAKSHWTEATVTVTGTTAKVTVDDKTYTAEGSLSGWVNKDGDWEVGGWPTCLEGGLSKSLPVTIGSTSVERHTITTWLAVDCSKA